MPAPRRPRERARTAVERTFVELANGVTHLHPDDIAVHVERCATLLGASEATLWLVDIDQRTLRALPEAAAGQRDVDEPGPGPGSAYRTETTVREPHPDGSGGTRLWIPLMDAAERLGVLGVVVGGDDDDPELWTAFASIIGETLVSKTAYGDSMIRTRRPHDVSLAAEMRWALLPPLTFTSPHVEISGVLEPAYDIAGDTFDYAADGDVLRLAVLDAMGHGLEASQIANLAVAEYRRGRRRDRSLDDLLHDMDEVIASQFGDNRFVTGQLAELDLTTGDLTVVNAGHPAPLLFRDGADVGDLPCRPCPPIGLGLIDTHETHTVLEAHDVVLFHTDGITESRSPGGEQFGRDRLAGVVVEALDRDERPAEILRQIVRAVAAHTDGPMRDDATAVILRRGRAARRA